MPERIDLSCPNGCFELELTGEHGVRDDRDFLLDVGIGEDPDCPECGASLLGNER